VPVTARSLDALRRVKLPYGIAICAHGGVILDQQAQPDTAWHARMSAQAVTHDAELTALAAVIACEARVRREPISVRVLTEGDLPLYVLVKHGQADAEALHAVVDAAISLVPSGWTDHRNGNNVALLPPYLGKQHAVATSFPAFAAVSPTRR
jgi:hypothetical protein